MNELHTAQQTHTQREREESILFKKVARVPSVTDSPMKGTTASNFSPTRRNNKTQLAQHQKQFCSSET
jgi:hypothetical protein